MSSASAAREQSSRCLEFAVFAAPPLDRVSQQLREDVAAAMARAAASVAVDVRGTAGSDAIRVRAELAHDDNDVQGMHALRSHVLSGDFDVALSDIRASRPDADEATTLTADRTGLVESFEAAARRALASGGTGLTSHQREKLAECAGQNHVHLTAPAGAGKTLIALQHLLQALKEPGGGDVLFVSRNAALGLFVAGQVVRSFPAGHRRDALRRLHLLHEPLEGSHVQRVGIRERRRLTHLPARPPKCRSGRVDRPISAADGGDSGGGSKTFSLVVVDEAHHVFSQPAARQRVAQLSSGSQLLLLSDISQSRGRDVAYPPGLREVTLTEVVRCTKRIVAGAMAFALGGTDKILTRCHHETTGPPCKSFLFDVLPAPADAVEARLLDAYADYTCRAIVHARNTFSGLRLHKRLAILVPDRTFADKLRPVLLEKLDIEFPAAKFCLINAVDALADVGGVVEEEDGDSSSSSSDDEAEFFDTEEVQGEDAAQATVRIDTRDTIRLAGQDTSKRSTEVADESNVSDSDGDDFEPAADGGQDGLLVRDHQHMGDGSQEAQTLLFDSVDQCDGLERLIVIGVGLDAPVEADTGGLDLTSPNALDTRSRIYRAMTRAQLMVSLVNEFVPGGLLEFLGHVRLRSDQQFDHAAEIARSDVAAVDTIIRSQLAAAITSLSADRQLAINAEVVELLSAEAAVLKDQGEVETAAVETVLVRWHRTLEAAGLALNCEVAQHQGMEPLTQEERSNAEIKIATALHRDQVPDLKVACSAQLRKIRLKRTAEMVDAALATARLASSGSWVPDEALAGLRRRIVAEYSPELDLALLCSSVVDKWRVLQGDICSAVATVVLQYRSNGIELPVDAIESVRARVISATCAMAVLDTTAVRSVTEAAFRDCADKFVEGRAREALAAGAKEMCFALPRDLSTLISELKAIKDKSVDCPAKQLIREWCELEAGIRAQLCRVRLACELHMSDEALEALLMEVSARAWQHRRDARKLTTIIEADFTKWVDMKKQDLENRAQIAAELQIVASARRFRLTDAAFEALESKVATAVRGGVPLKHAVVAALRAWEREVVRSQVQQTVWDPSSNSTAKASGVVKFMPFKRAKSEGHLYEMLVSIFRFAVALTVLTHCGMSIVSLLSFEELAAASLCCRRWHAVASDPSWQQELIVYAWGAPEVSGLTAEAAEPRLLDFGMKEQVLSVTCADEATLALTTGGDVFHFGKSWSPECPAESVPVRLTELRDVTQVSCSPAGYFHGRGDTTYGRYSCAALTSTGELFTWGRNMAGQCLQGGQELVLRPSRVVLSELLDEECVVTMIGCGLDYLALCVAKCDEREDREADGSADTTTGQTGQTKVLTCGRFCREPPHQLTEAPNLRGVPLRQLACGSFHCVAVTTRGQLYTFGSPIGRDQSNGNLLGTGDPRADRTDVDELNDSDDDSDDSDFGVHMRAWEWTQVQPPRLVRGIGPVASMSCSSYLNIAITVDGRVFTWGDSDGDALGHEEEECNVPRVLAALRGCRVTRGAASYTNAAVATDQGRLYVWGGNAWEGGISGGRQSQGPSEIQWDRACMPQHYRLSSVALGHHHGFLIFRKRP